MSVHFWEFYALGERQVRGYVCKGGIMAEITELAVDWQGDAQLNHRAFQCRVCDDAGRGTLVEGKVFGIYALRADPAFTLNEGAARISIDGKPGSGWMEMGWPQPYLDHIAAGPGYC